MTNNNPFWLKILHSLPPETAHYLTLSLLNRAYFINPRLVERMFCSDSKDYSLLDPSSMLPSSLQAIKNPIGLAAGFDKNAGSIKPLSMLGFGFIEVGTVTPKAQSGNPKPRLFRFKEYQALINRLGFNNKGFDSVFENLKKSQTPDIVPVGVNLGINKHTKEPINEYKQGILKFNPISDYMVINVSSPNTENLRSFQQKEQLETLLDEIITTKNSLPQPHKPIFIKIAPDLEPTEIESIADITCSLNLDGIIVSNTTTSRPFPAKESGGMSGRPLFETSNQALWTLTSHIKKHYPKSSTVIVGCGGISSGEDVYKKIRLGAHIIQLYSALVYQGPILIQLLKSQLKERIEKDGYSHISQIVGIDI